MLNIALMMNNYFHDLATALLLTSGAVIYVFVRQAENTDNRAVLEYFIGSYKKLTFLGRLSFAWIILAGVIRLTFFRSFEWVDAVGKDQVPALIVKHVIIFIFVGLGIYYWRKLSRKIKVLEDLHQKNLIPDAPAQLVEESL